MELDQIASISSREQGTRRILDLMDIVELVVAPVHTDKSNVYLESKISEHRKRYQAASEAPFFRTLSKDD